MYMFAFSLSLVRRKTFAGLFATVLKSQVQVPLWKLVHEFGLHCGFIRCFFLAHFWALFLSQRCRAFCDTLTVHSGWLIWDGMRLCPQKCPRKSTQLCGQKTTHCGGHFLKHVSTQKSRQKRADRAIFLEQLFLIFAKWQKQTPNNTHFLTTAVIHRRNMFSHIHHSRILWLDSPTNICILPDTRTAITITIQKK